MGDERAIGVEERDLDDAALEALADAVAAPPPAGLRARVVEGVRRDAERTRLAVRLRRWRAGGLAAAAAAAGFALLLANASLRTREQAIALDNLAASHEALVARLERQERELGVLGEALASQSETLRILAGPRLLSASLFPQAGRAGSARVLVDADSGSLAIVGSDLGPPGEGKVYELWAIRGEAAPEPAGLIERGGEPAFAQRLEALPDPRSVSAFAVSIEPAGGSPAPTGPIVLVGAVQS
jgi:anti-sigma-K factor RskA